MQTEVLPDSVGALRQLVLETVAAAHEPVTLSALPRRWPLTRAHLTICARQLVLEGLLAPEPDPHTGRPDRLRITEAGREWLRGER